jgi:hypothetical protein
MIFQMPSMRSNVWKSTHEADANPLIDVGRLCAFLDQLQAELRLSPPA